MRVSAKETLWFIFHEGELFITNENGTHAVPCGMRPPIEIPQGANVHAIGEIGGIPCKTFQVSQQPPCHENGQWTGLRESYDYIDLKQYKMAGKAAQILYWDRNSRYCPACGTPTVQTSPICKQCPRCKQEYYPPISTAIIVLVRKGDSILLVHARNFKGTFHGLVAGFLETGETLEECVQREVMEETGLAIKNIRYFGSQPWPYPSGLMVGFTADYDGGEIKLQEDELTAGAFYTKDHLPEIPKRLSMARQLIDGWLKEQEEKNR